LEIAKKNYDSAQDLCNGSQIGIECFKNTLTNIFPELKESEDEKIRGAIIHFISHTPTVPKGIIGKETMLAWLEKQGEPQDKGEISDGYHTFNELYYYRMLYNAAFFNMLPKEWVHKSKRHNDGEECFGGGWFIVMANLPTGQISNHYELKDWDLFQIPEKEVADKWDGHTPQEAADRLHKYLLEKHSEQKLAGKAESKDYSSIDPHFGKPIDKVESKFHEGDWVILTAGELSTTLQIVSVDINKKLYWFNDSSYLPIVDEECLHHWTIQDAKDGDVLVNDEGKPFIFKGLLDAEHPNCPVAYGGVCINCYDVEEFCISERYRWWCDLIGVKPATKEQRDALIKAMADAGYEWDAERKELKEIVNKEQIKENLQDNSFRRMFEQKSSWGEEDEKIYNRLCGIVHNAAFANYDVDEVGKECGEYAKITEWLKSIKQRMDDESPTI
jgi:hypothetical protein